MAKSKPYKSQGIHEGNRSSENPIVGGTVVIILFIYKAIEELHLNYR